MPSAKNKGAENTLFSEKTVTSRPNRFLVSGSKNRSRLTVNKTKLHFILNFSILNTHAYTRETCRDFRATFGRNTIHFKATPRQEGYPSTPSQKHQDKPGGTQRRVFSTLEQPDTIGHHRQTGEEERAHGSPNNQTKNY